METKGGHDDEGEDGYGDENDKGRRSNRLSVDKATRMEKAKKTDRLKHAEVRERDIEEDEENGEGEERTRHRRQRRHNFTLKKYLQHNFLERLTHNNDPEDLPTELSYFRCCHSTFLVIIYRYDINCHSFHFLVCHQ